MTTLFSTEGWVDKRAELDEERAKIKPWTYLIVPGESEEALISSSEVGCPKTDVGARPFRSLKTLLAKKEIVPAKDLSAAEQVDVADALLVFQAMMLGRNHSIHSTLGSCAYFADMSLLGAAGDAATQPLRALLRSVVKLTYIILRVVLDGEVRDGDEEFQPVMLTTGAELRGVRSAQILEELDAAIASSSCPAELKTRIALQRALFATIYHFGNCHNAIVIGEDQEAKNQANIASGKIPSENDDAAAPAPADETDKVDLLAVLKSLQTATAAWTRADEPKLVSKAFSEFVPGWATNVAMSQKIAPLAPIAFAKDVWKQLYKDLATVFSWRVQKLASKDYYTILRAVKNFAQVPPAAMHSVGATAPLVGANAALAADPQAGLPCLVARSIASTFLYDRRTGNVLGSAGKPVVDVLTHTLDLCHGAPIYGHIVAGTHDATHAVAGAHYDHIRSVMMAQVALSFEGKGAADQATVTQHVDEAIGSQKDFAAKFRSDVKAWLMQVAQAGIVYINALLHTRSRCHRMLPTQVGQVLTTVVQRSDQMEVRVNARPISGHAELARLMQSEGERLARHFAVTHFFVDLLFDVAETMLSAEVTLGLVAPAELPALLLYRHTLCKLRDERLKSTLYMGPQQLPEPAQVQGKDKRKLVAKLGAGAVFRQAREMPASVAVTLQATLRSANISFLALNALAAALPGGISGDEEPPLMSTEVAFMRRVDAVRQMLPGGEMQLPAYSYVRTQINKVRDDTVNGGLAAAIQLLQQLVPLAKQAVQRDGGNAKDSAMRAVHVAEKLGAQNLAVLGLVKTLAAASQDGDIRAALAGYSLGVEYSIECPVQLLFSLKKN